MRSHRSSTRIGRRRRRFGLAIFAAGLLLGLVFAASAKWWFGYCGETWLVDLGDGSLYIRQFEEDRWSKPLLGWRADVNHSYVNDKERTWTWTWWHWGEQTKWFEPMSVYSIWPLSPMLALAGVLLYLPGRRALRRERREQCTRCAYSLAGLAPSAPCPECGHERSAAT